jgi:hypothetical protein
MKAIEDDLGFRNIVDNETIIELFFYCFSGVGLLIGLVAFIFRHGKMIAEENNL